MLDAEGPLAQVLKRGEPATLLCDELEKAHPLVLGLFLQILDAARITLATGETRSAAHLYIVFTSNLGAVEAMRMERSGRTCVERAVPSPRVAENISVPLEPPALGR